MPLQRRLPKRGFNNRFKKEFSELNVGRLGVLAAAQTSTPMPCGPPV